MVVARDALFVGFGVLVGEVVRQLVVAVYKGKVSRISLKRPSSQRDCMTPGLHPVLFVTQGSGSAPDVLAPALKRLSSVRRELGLMTNGANDTTRLASAV